MRTRSPKTPGIALYARFSTQQAERDSGNGGLCVGSALLLFISWGISVFMNMDAQNNRSKRLSEWMKARHASGEMAKIMEARALPLVVFACVRCGKESLRKKPSPTGACVKCAQFVKYQKNPKKKDSPARQHTPEIVRLYADQNMGHKAIAKALRISPRITREILIEQGVYQPGRLYQSDHHKKRTSEAGKARIPAWRHEEIKRERKSASKRTRAFRDLPLFKPVYKSTPESRKKDADYARERYQTDPTHRLIQVLRKRLNKVARRGRGYGGDNLPWLGCTPEQLRAHIEAQWTEGMTWETYGPGLKGWHIDHIKPCSAFDMTHQSQREACFHYTNLRPLWGAENIAKSDKYISAWL